MLSNERGKGAARTRLAESIERQIEERKSSGFDLDSVLDDELTMPARVTPLITMRDLDRVIASPALMPPGVQVRPLGEREYGLRLPGMAEEIRVTTDPEYYEEHAQSVELWSPGNPLFKEPELLAERGELAGAQGLKDILDAEQ